MLVVDILAQVSSFSIFSQGLSYPLFLPCFMHFSYLLSFVEISSCLLSIDHPEGSVLRCCSRSLRQFADPTANLQALDSYETFLEEEFIEALRQEALDKEVLLAFHTEGHSDDY